MCVCMGVSWYVCMCMHMCAYVRACIDACVGGWMFACMIVCLYNSVSPCVRAYVCTPTCMLIHKLTEMLFFRHLEQYHPARAETTKYHNLYDF